MSSMDPLFMSSMGSNMYGTGMYNNETQIKNTYSYDQNKQTDSILNYNTSSAHFNAETSTSMNQHNYQGTLMTSGVCAAGGAAIGATFSPKGFKSSSKAAVAGALIGFAAPTVVKTVKDLF